LIHGTGIVTDERCNAHDPGDDIPEHPRRLAAIAEALSRVNGAFVRLHGRPAENHELERLHSPTHVRRIAATAGGGRVALAGDTMASTGSDLAARVAVGACLEAVAAVMTNRLTNAFALVRPPGHHAEFSRAMGYCLFNNVALAAAFALEVYGLKKILIVDWDLHHGNGTQHLFEADPRVLFVSLHQYPLFPGTGHFTETGRGRGEGYTINLPLPLNWGDGAYAAVFQRVIVPVTRAFVPELILVSAGFDSHRLDPMGAMQMSAEGFAALTRCLMDLAGELCGHRLVLALEGGYHDEALSSSVAAVLAELSNATMHSCEHLAARADERQVKKVLTRCWHVHRTFWKCLESAV
jgi:acetoin utilization deacetylase AcuC-like enzyme